MYLPGNMVDKIYICMLFYYVFDIAFLAPKMVPNFWLKFLKFPISNTPGPFFFKSS